MLVRGDMLQANYDYFCKWKQNDIKLKKIAHYAIAL